jgi:hypothetical protein
MSWVQREYFLHTGQAGMDSYNNGTAQGVIETLIFFQFGWNSILRGLSLEYTNGEWILHCLCDITSLTSTQITQLDSFMNGINNTVIGVYPPRLLSPAKTFIKTAYSVETLADIRTDLAGRGLGRQLTFYNGDNLEYWADAAYSAGQKNQLAGMWKNRFLDASTNRPL